MVQMERAAGATPSDEAASRRVIQKHSKEAMWLEWKEKEREQQSCRRVMWGGGSYHVGSL